jgi:hypothetical protein
VKWNSLNTLRLRHDDGTGISGLRAAGRCLGENSLTSLAPTGVDQDKRRALKGLLENRQSLLL